MNLRPIGGGLLAVVFMAPILAAQDPAMLQADTSFAQAAARSDKLALEKLLDAEFTWTDGRGRVLSRAQVLREPPAVASGTGNVETKGYTYGNLGNVQVNAGRVHVLRVWAKRADGWKAMVYQELASLDAAPTFTPGAGKECENPCKAIGFMPKTGTERQVVAAYLKLETAAHARNSAGFAPMVAEEFVAASSNSDRVQTKRSRIEDFNRSKDAGVAPTPLRSARMFTFGDAVLMVSEHQPDRGNPLHVTRLWVKRGGWVETLSYQTAVR